MDIDNEHSLWIMKYILIWVHIIIHACFYKAKKGIDYISEVILCIYEERSLDDEEGDENASIKRHVFTGDKKGNMMCFKISIS